MAATTKPEVHPGTGRADEHGLLMVKSPAGAERWYAKATFTVAEAGELLGLSRRTAFRKADSCALPTIDLDGQRRVTAAGLDRALFRDEYANASEPVQTDEVEAAALSPQPENVSRPSSVKLDEYGFPIEEDGPQDRAAPQQMFATSPKLPPVLRRETPPVLRPETPPLEYLPETADGQGGGLLVPGIAPRQATDEDDPDHPRPFEFIPYY